MIFNKFQPIKIHLKGFIKNLFSLFVFSLLFSACVRDISNDNCLALRHQNLSEAGNGAYINFAVYNPGFSQHKNSSYRSDIDGNVGDDISNGKWGIEDGTDNEIKIKTLWVLMFKQAGTKADSKLSYVFKFVKQDQLPSEDPSDDSNYTKYEGVLSGNLDSETSIVDNVYVKGTYRSSVKRVDPGKYYIITLANTNQAHTLTVGGNSLEYSDFLQERYDNFYKGNFGSYSFESEMKYYATALSLYQLDNGPGTEKRSGAFHDDKDADFTLLSTAFSSEDSDKKLSVSETDTYADAKPYIVTGNTYSNAAATNRLAPYTMYIPLRRSVAKLRVYMDNRDPDGKLAKTASAFQITDLGIHCTGTYAPIQLSDIKSEVLRPEAAMKSYSFFPDMFKDYATAFSYLKKAKDDHFVPYVLDENASPIAPMKELFNVYIPSTKVGTASSGYVEPNSSEIETLPYFYMKVKNISNNKMYVYKIPLYLLGENGSTKNYILKSNHIYNFKLHFLGRRVLVRLRYKIIQFDPVTIDLPAFN